MKRFSKTVLAGLISAGSFGIIAQAEETNNIRKIAVYDNSNLTPMVTKVYDLQHAKATDLTPFVSSAVQSMRGNSKVDRLSFKAQGTQHLIVSMDADYTEQIDDLIKKLDRPGLVGTGIHNFTYTFMNRSAFGIFEDGPVAADTHSIASFLDSADSTYHRFDVDSIAWKDSLSDGQKSAQLLKELDVPIPQAEFVFTVYEIAEDDLKDLGVDYNAWQQFYKKNGLFTKNWVTGSFDTGVAHYNPTDFTNFDFTIDASFLRILQNKGKAKISNRGSIVVKNKTGDVKGVFRPDSENAKINMGTDFTVEINRDNTTIFYGAEQVNLDYTVTYQSGGNVCTFDCERLKIGYGEESIAASLNKQHVVEEFVGIPFLSEIPVLKYLFGTETKSKINIKQYLTIQVKNATPDTNMTEDAEVIMNDVLASVK